MKIINAAFAGLAIVVLGGAALLPAVNESSSRKDPSNEQIDSFAMRIVDEFEKRLMELPLDGKMGWNRMSRVVVPTHLGIDREVRRNLDSGQNLNLGISAFSLGQFDKQGNSGRVRFGTHTRSKNWESVDLKSQKQLDPVLKRVKTDTKSLINSGQKDLKTWAMTNDQPVIIYSRAIFPKKECLSCHTEAKMGKTMGVAALVLTKKGEQRNKRISVGASK
jgi:hypothetical protein